MKNLIYCLLMLNSFLFIRVVAQDSTTHKYKAETSTYWIAAGIGNCYFGPTFKTNLSYSYKQNTFTVRYYVSEEFRFAAGDHQFENPPLKIKEIGLLYGIPFRKQAFVLNLNGGLAYINGTLRGELISKQDYQHIKISTLSIPLEGNFRIEFSKYFGIGGTMFSNINSKKVYYGWSAEIYLGKLR